jgi:excinuclease ABC subunit C
VKILYLKIDHAPVWNIKFKDAQHPCVNLISEEDYREDIDQAMMFLNGKDTKVINSLSEKMNIFSENNEFERAAVFRDRIQSLRQVRLKQFVSDFSEE